MRLALFVLTFVFGVGLLGHSQKAYAQIPGFPPPAETLSDEPANPNQASAEAIASTCTGCHGKDGNSAGPAAPSIAGISFGYFTLAMDGYLRGTRNSTIMRRIAKGYSWSEIKALAAYFSAKTLIPKKQYYDARLVPKGRRLHNRYCERCHRDGGKFSGRSGILAGQLVPYLRTSLKDMMSGKREMPHNMGRWMRRLIRLEGKDSIEVLLNYYASRRK